MKSIPSQLRAPLRAACCAFLIAPLVVVSACRHHQPVSLTVSVAASLTDAITQVESQYQRDHPGIEIKNNFGGSGTLARQIEDGAPVDVFFSAAAKPMDDLQSRGLLVSGSRRDVLHNELVLIAPPGSHLGGFQQLGDSTIRTIAIGDPGSVPAGQYAQQTLAYFHLVHAVQDRLVLAKDVRQVLAYVATGNADAGLVYATDATVNGKVKVVATAPDAAHDSIVYPVAAIAGSAHPAEASDFAGYLTSAAAQAVFTRYGFTISK